MPKKIVDFLNEVKAECSKSKHCCNCKLFRVRGDGCPFKNIPRYWNNLDSVLERMGKERK